MSELVVERVSVRKAGETRERLGRYLGRGAWFLAIAVATVLALASLMPLYWMITGSFKIQYDSISYPPQMFPTNPTLKNWQSLLVGRSTLRWLLNSIIVAGAISGFSVLTSTLAGYAFGKKRFPGQTGLFWAILLTMMLPRQISLIPLFVMMRDLKWVDTYQAMVAPYIAYPFGIFLVKQFMQCIPNDLIDAARIDGASEMQLFWRVILPLTKPAVGAVAIFAFMFGWNDYLWQLVIINKDAMTTLPIGISKLVAGWASVDIGLGMAGATLAFIPMLLIFIFFQDYFVKGITMGAVKG